MDEKTKLSAMADKLLIGKYHRHVFLCIGEDCCSAEEGAAAWEALKKELKDRNLSLSTGPNACFRTKVQCLRVCSNGPILVVYPEGTYYYGMTADKIPEFVQKHLIDGQPIEERVFARNPLPLAPLSPGGRGGSNYRANSSRKNACVSSHRSAAFSKFTPIGFT